MDAQNAAVGQNNGVPVAPRTRFSDVCGTIDELKRMLHEESDVLATQPEALESLVDDALTMLARMEPRLREYEHFRAEVVGIAGALQTLGDARRAEAEAAASALRPLLRRGDAWSAADSARAESLAEEIRAVAQDLENTLYRYKDAALALARAYRTIQGARSWVLDDEDAQTTAALSGEPEWSRWLPPSPHRERILRYLRVGRAHLLPPDGAEGPDRPPLLQFEDGGIMPLHVVRWSEEVRNFYPADAPPHPRGLLYRDPPEEPGTA